MVKAGVECPSRSETTLIGTPAAGVRAPSPNPCLGSTVSGHEPRGGVEEDTVGSCARDEDVAEFAKAGFNLVVTQLVREAPDDALRSREGERIIDRVPEVIWLVERRERDAVVACRCEQRVDAVGVGEREGRRCTRGWEGERPS